MITLYQQHDSGNCYKVRLVLTHLRLPFQTVAVSSNDGSTRQPEFLAKNPIGKVPTIQLDDGRYLAESNAILLHLAEGTALLPADPYDRAKVYEWLFFEQYNHEPAIAVRRALSVYPERRAEAHPGEWRSCWRLATRRSRSWSAGSAPRTGSPAMRSRSLTFRSTPTLTWRLTADTICGAIQGSADG
jgi:glutathione S-transferase